MLETTIAQVCDQRYTAPLFPAIFVAVCVTVYPAETVSVVYRTVMQT